MYFISRRQFTSYFCKNVLYISAAVLTRSLLQLSRSLLQISLYCNPIWTYEELKTFSSSTILPRPLHQCFLDLISNAHVIFTTILSRSLHQWLYFILYYICLSFIQIFRYLQQSSLDLYRFPQQIPTRQRKTTSPFHASLKALLIW